MKKITPLVLLLIAVAFVSSGFLPIRAATGNVKGLDYSNPNSPVVVEMTPEELMKYLTGEDISEVEAEYLESTIGTVFTYSDVIPQKNVETSYFAGTLSIVATVYEYQTTGGATVKWVPTVARLGEESIALTDSSSQGKYEGCFEGVADDDTRELKVEYVCRLKISAGVANGFKNYTYDYALSLWQENEEYNKKFNEYEAYQQYLKDLDAYNNRKKQWEDYETAYNNWLRKDDEYNNYINVLLPAYEKAYDEWKAYDDEMKKLPAKVAEYEAYLAADKTFREVTWPAYLQYLADVDRAIAMLDVMESIYVIDETYGKQLYGTIMGNLVDNVMDSVESEYKTLQSAGMKISLETIKETRTVTQKLRPLLEGYKNLADPIAKFNYYKANYIEIKNCFNTLSKNLSAMFQDNTIKTSLKNLKGDYYFRRYIQFVCHLYVVSTGLDDEIRNPNWFIDGEQTDPPTIPATYVPYYWNGKWHGYLNDEEEKYILDPQLKIKDDATTSRNPANIPELQIGVEPPKPPAVVEDPRLNLPEEVKEPTEPDVVNHPGSRPAAPLEALGEPPSIVPNGGDTPPDRVIYTEQQLALIQAIEDRVLVKRSIGESVTIELKTELSRALVLDDKCIVSFYDHTGKQLLASYTLDIGAVCVYDKVEPTRENTDKIIYTFEGWKDEDGNLVAGDIVTAGNYMSFYASYGEEVKKYNVTWIVDGVSTTEKYEYGATPTYSGVPIKAESNWYTYVFKGWNKPISIVKGNATYEAEFDSIVKLYTVEWIFGENVYSEQYRYGDVPSFKQNTSDFTDGKYIYSFLCWDKNVTAVNGNTVYTAKFKKTSIVENMNGELLDVELEESVYNVEVPEQAVKVDSLLRLAFDNDSKVKLSFDSVGAELILNEAMVSEMLQSGCKYVYIYLNEEKSVSSATVKYNVRFVNGSGKDISLAHGVNVSFKNNIKSATKAYIVAKNGAESPIAYTVEDGVLSLKVKESCVIALKNEYSITIGECVNGTMISSASVAMPGDTITLTLWFTDGYYIDFVKVIGNETGTEYPISGEGKFTFIMPDESVTVSAKLTESEYTIKFVVDGVVISEQIYHKGDIVVPPENPTKAQDGDTVYMFVGWSPTITPVSGDAVYTAEFQATTVGTESYGGERGNFYVILNIVVVASVVVIALIIVTICVCHKKKKVKKAANVSKDN